MTLFFGRRGKDEPPAQTPENAVRLALRFAGRVQGVGFRWTSAMVARELDLTGWVRNEDDGSVTAEVQGTPEHVGAFFSQLLDAFRGRHVNYVVTRRDDIPVVWGEQAFEVRY